MDIIAAAVCGFLYCININMRLRSVLFIKIDQYTSHSTIIKKINRLCKRQNQRKRIKQFLKDFYRIIAAIQPGHRQGINLHVNSLTADFSIKNR